MSTEAIVAQTTTFVTNPRVGTSKTCADHDINCTLVSGSPNPHYYNGNTINMKVTQIDNANRKIYFQVKKCDNSKFIGSGFFNLREEICGDVNVNFNSNRVYFSAGNSSVSIVHL